MRDPEQQPGAAGLQPAVGRSPIEVPARWLTESEQIGEVQNLNRLLGDALLVDTLRESRFTGITYEVFETELVKYGLGVIIGWSIRGVIFERCRARGYGGLPRPVEGTFTREAIVGIAHETVARAAVHFRDDVLLRGVWNPKRGASLKTFFVGQCLRRFPNVYRSWYREQLELIDKEGPWWNVASLDRLAELAGDAELAEPAHSKNPEKTVIDRDVVAEALEQVKDPRVRVALLMREDGYRQDEIARRLGVTRKAVERMLANHQDRMHKRRAAP
jgi:DNA-directed RNA polymerase specialized sigma24 family protein